MIPYYIEVLYQVDWSSFTHKPKNIPTVTYNKRFQNCGWLSWDVYEDSIVDFVKISPENKVR